MCAFTCLQIKYYGHDIGPEWHQPDPKKLCTIGTIEALKTKTTLKCVPELFNFYHNCIKDYAKLAKPFNRSN